MELFRNIAQERASSFKKSSLDGALVLCIFCYMIVF